MKTLLTGGELSLEIPKKITFLDTSSVVNIACLWLKKEVSSAVEVVLFKAEI